MYSSSIRVKNYENERSDVLHWYRFAEKKPQVLVWAYHCPAPLVPLRWGKASCF